MSRLSEFLMKLSLLFGLPVVLAVAGFLIPMLFDRDVGGAIASEVLTVVGGIVGFILAIVIIHREF
jgi:hypothetical protein